MRRAIVVALLIAVAILFVRVILVARDFASVVTAVRFEALRTDHVALRAFLRRMPKGADLHVHLSGAVYAERIITFAALDGLCVRQPTSASSTRLAGRKAAWCRQSRRSAIRRSTTAW